MNIRQAKVEDKEIVTSSFLKLVQYLQDFDYEVLPTPENAEIAWDLIFEPSIEEGYPILIAESEGEPVSRGVLFWSKCSTPFELRHETIYSFGLWMDPGLRNGFGAIEMIKRGKEIAKEIGVEEVRCMAHKRNSSSQALLHQVGAEFTMDYGKLKI